MDLLCFCSVLCLLCLCARLFICALWSPAGKRLTSWISFVVSTMSLSLSHWYPGSGVVLDCIDSWCLHPYLLCMTIKRRCRGLRYRSNHAGVWHWAHAWTFNTLPGTEWIVTISCKITGIFFCWWCEVLPYLKVFYSCQMPEEGHYVICDKCNMWYHLSCVGLDINEIPESGISYFCKKKKKNKKKCLNPKRRKKR